MFDNKLESVNVVLASPVFSTRTINPSPIGDSRSILYPIIGTISVGVSQDKIISNAGTSGLVDATRFCGALGGSNKSFTTVKLLKLFNAFPAESTILPDVLV